MSENIELIDLLQASQTRDPYPFFEQLRNTAAMYQTSSGHWLISGYDEAAFLLSDSRCQHWHEQTAAFSSRHSIETSLMKAVADFAPKQNNNVRSVTLKQIHACLGNESEAFGLSARALLRSLVHRPSFDVIADFAHPLAFGSACRVIGIPEQDIQGLSQTISPNSNYLKWVRFPGCEPFSEERTPPLFGYLKQYIKKKNQNLGTDVTSTMFAQSNSENDESLINLLLLIFHASHQNMMSFVGLALLALETNKDLFRLLRQQSTQVGDIALELIRFDSPLQFIPLLAVDNVELGENHISAGDQLWICVGATNRDPRQFANPNRIDINRRPVKQLSFGWGENRCIGANLATTQGGQILRYFSEIVEDFHIDQQSIEWRGEPIVQRGPSCLNVVISNYV